MRLRLPLLACLAILGLTAAAWPAAAAASGRTRVTHEVVESFDGEPLYTTLFMPAGTEGPAPLVMRSHGWAGHGARSLAEASSTTKALLDAGYAVLTWDERGFGYSGGQVHVLKPDFEGRDASVLIDWLATDPEIASTIACENGRDPDGTCADPVIGMTGASYGGGIQLLTAAFDAEYSSTTDGDEPRVDAIAPEITWNDLRYSLYDNEVVNVGWSELLYAAGVPAARLEGLDPRNPAGPQAGGLDEQIHEAQIEFQTTNQFSRETVEFYGHSSLAVYGDEHPVAVPSLFIQGSGDTLFDLTEAARNFHHVRGRAPAKLIAYCGGHVACPPYYANADDRRFLDQAILDWFAKYLKGRDVDTGAPVAYRTNEGGWRTARDFTPDDAAYLAASGEGTILATPAPTTADVDDLAGLTSILERPTNSPLTTAQPNPPGDPHAFSVQVAEARGGDMELVGVPRAHLTVSGTGQVAHLFLKLVDRETGEVVNLQETPVRVENLSSEPKEFDVTMSGIAYTLPEGHHLDLQVSTTSVMHATARVPARVDVRVTVEVPVRPGTRDRRS